MKTGEYVVYGGSEICLIDGIEEKCFDGVNKLSYYRLIPCETPKSTYYVPDNKLAERTRPLLTREEILAVIDEMPTVRAEWILDKNQRKSTFSQMIKSNDYHQILCVMKSLYNEQSKRTDCGRKLSSMDERVLTAAQKLLHKEFAFVLGIKEDEVGEFIDKRLAEINEQHT